MPRSNPPCMEEKGLENKEKKKRKKMNDKRFLSILTVLFLLTLSGLPLVAYAEGPTIWTDKNDYSPDETVNIFGSGFTPNSPIIVNVTRPDGHVDSSLDEGTDVVYKVTIVYLEDGTCDSEGKFNATYKLDGITGEYKVIASDGIIISPEISFTDKIQFKLKGTDGSFYDSPDGENLTSYITDSFLIVTNINLKATGLGPDPQSWSIAYDLSYVNSTLLNSYTVFTPASGTFFGASDNTNIKMNISLNTLSSGIYKAKLIASGSGAESDVYYFTFTYTPSFVSFTVSGYKLDTEDDPLDGWTINLFKDGSPHSIAVTGDDPWADGYYEFVITAPGSYEVGETLQAGWTKISPTGNYTFTATSGHENIINQNFTNFKWATVYAKKVEYGAGALSGWTINMPDATPTSDATNSTGWVKFTVKNPGAYHISETTQSGWTLTSPASNDYLVDVQTSGGVYGAAGAYTFTNFKWVTVSGYKYHYDGGFSDNFNDGNALGWNVLAGTWSVVDDSGNYVYSGAATGNEQVTYALMAGTYANFVYEVKLKAVNNEGHYGLILREDGTGRHYGFYINAKDFEEGNYYFGYWNGVSYDTIIPWTSSQGAYVSATGWNTIKVVANGNVFKLYINQVLVNTATDEESHISSGYIGLIVDRYLTYTGQNTYFDDIVVMNNDRPINNFEIKLYKDDVYNHTDYTDSNGYYEFLVKEPGIYSIKEVITDGWTSIYPIYRVPSSSTEEVQGYSFTVKSGREVRCRDFWNFEWLTISGNKTDYSNRLGLSGWTIKLYNTTEEYASTTTDGDGDYSFTVKDPGTYAIKEVLKEGWTAISPTYQVGDEASTVEVQGYSFTVVSGTNVSDKNFENFDWVTVSGQKRDTEDVGLNSWVITLKKGGVQVGDTVTTSGGGLYSFTVKEPGTYTVEETLKPQWTQISAPSSFTVASGVNEPNKDFVNFEWLTVSGNKYEDKEGDPPLRDWTINLYRFCDDFEDGNTIGWTEVAGTWSVIDDGTGNNVYKESSSLQNTYSYATITSNLDDFIMNVRMMEKVDKGYDTMNIIFRETDSGHFYMFSLRPQENAIKFYKKIGYDGAYGTSSWTHWQQLSSSSFTFAKDTWYDVTLKVEGSSFTGTVGSTTITTSDADYTIGRVGLMTNEADAYFDDVCIYSTTETDVNGYYEFTIFYPGTYSIKEVLPSGWTQISPELHYGDGSAVLGYSDIVVSSGIDVEDNDFVNFKWLTISGVKKDTEGALLDGWMIKLYNTTTNVYDFEETSGGGAYSFLVKDPGTYIIKEVLPSGWTETSPALNYGDGSEVLGYSGIIVESGKDIIEQDFVNFEWITVSGYKYEQVFCDGFEDGEAESWAEVGSGGIWSVHNDPDFGGLVYSQEDETWKTTTTYDTYWRSYDGIFGTNYIIEAKVKIVDGGFAPIAGIFFRVQGDDLNSGYYMFRIDARADTAPALIRSPNTILAGGHPGQPQWYGYDPATIGQIYSLKVVVEGNNFKCYVDDVLKYDVTDSTYSNGKIGVGTFNSHSHFDDVCVKVPLSDWDMSLYSHPDYPDSAAAYATNTTDSHGYYEFIVKDPGQYAMYEDLAEGWTELSPEYKYGHDEEELGYTGITVVSGVDQTGYDFVNFKWVTISGNKTDYSSGSGLSGWGIELHNSTGKYASTTTDCDGNYSFTVKDPGTYSIKEVLPYGWTETSPVLNYGDGSSVLGYEGITVISGTNVTKKDFVNFEWITVSGHKYEQAFCDDFEDGVSKWEPVLGFLGNWQWQIDNSINTPDNYVYSSEASSEAYSEVKDVFTGDVSWTDYVYEANIKLISGDDAGLLFRYQDSNNFYIFCIDNIPSRWTIWEKVGGSWTQLYEDTSWHPTLNTWYNLKVEAVGSSIKLYIDDVMVKNFTDDSHLNGKVGLRTHTTTHAHFDDVCVKLPKEDWDISIYKQPYDLSDPAYTSNKTDEYGYYELLLKDPGTYNIYEYLENGWTELYPEYVYGDNKKELGYCDVVATSGVNQTEYDFWNFKWLTISGNKTDYSSGSGLSDWDIELHNSTGIYNSTTTDCEGYYSFTVKDPGTYSIKEVLQDKWTEITPVLTYSPGDGSTPSVLGYSCITVTSGQNVVDKNFVNFEWITVSGHKTEHDGLAFCDDFEDGDLSGWTNVNGVWTVKEVSGNKILEQSLPYYIPGVRISESNIWDDFTITAKVNVTGTAEGRWGGIIFRVINPGTHESAGTYYELYLQENGYLQLTKTIDGVRTWPGGSWNSPEFRQYVGLFYNEWWNIKAEVTDGHIKGKAWEVGTTEPAGWIIDWTDFNPLTEGKIGLITFSNVADQPVYFDDVCVVSKPLSGWEIQLEQTSDPSSPLTTMTDDIGYYKFIVKNPGEYTIKECLPEGWTEISPLLKYGVGNYELGYTLTAVSGVDVINKNFVNFKWLTISGVKKDTEGDLLDGWTMKLYNTTTNLYDSNITDATTGAYSFLVKDPGTYAIKEVLKEGWTAISPTYQVGNEASTVEVQGYSFPVVSGTNVSDNDFVNFKWIFVSGYKFFDVDGNGTREAGEPGLDYWTITLNNSTTQYCEPENTTGGGSYQFIIKDPGEYTISETLKPPMWINTTKADYTFTAESGVNVTHDFGNWLDGAGFVSTSGLCYFDVDNNVTNGRQFKLIYHPDVPDYPHNYRLTASNPGQFYYNVFYNGEVSEGFNITIPYPFVTHGAVPIHVYSSLNTGPEGCLIPVDDITSQFDIDPLTISLDDWSGKNFGNTIEISIDGSYSGFIYINVHLDYGLKKNIGNLTKTDTTAHNGTISITNDYEYMFSVSVEDITDTDIVKNLNVFKHDPGIGGLVLDENDDPVEGIEVNIYKGKDLFDTVKTDEDGWYMAFFKYTGKPTSFTVKVEGYVDQTVTLKANGFLVINFDYTMLTSNYEEIPDPGTTDPGTPEPIKPPKKK